MYAHNNQSLTTTVRVMCDNIVWQQNRQDSLLIRSAPLVHVLSNEKQARSLINYFVHMWSELASQQWHDICTAEDIHNYGFSSSARFKAFWQSALTELL